MSHSHNSMSGMDDMTSTNSSMADMKMYFHGSIGSDMLWFESWMPSSAGATVGVCIGLFLLAIFERYLVAFRRACDASWRRGRLGFHNPSTSGAYSHPPPPPFEGYTDDLPPSSSAQRRPSTQKLDGPSSSTTYDLEKHSPPPLLPPTTQHRRPTSSSSASSSSERERAQEMEAYSHLPRAVRRGLDPGREGRWSRPFRWGVDVPRGFLQMLQTLIHYLLMLVAMSFNIWWILSLVIGAGVGETLFGRFGSSHAGH